MLQCIYFKVNTVTSKCIKITYDEIVRYMYAFRSIGKGFAEKMFLTIMNMALPKTSIKKHNAMLLRASTEVCEASCRSCSGSESRK